MNEDAMQAMPRYDEQGNVIPLDESVLAEYSFGSRVAEQMNATMEIEGKEARAPRQEGSDEEPPKAKAPVDYHEKLAEMSFDDRVDASVECLNRRGSFRDILYGLIGFCREERSYEDIEPFVEGFADFLVNRQEPRRYVFMLLRTGALEEIELKEDGTPLTEEDKQAAIDEGLDPEDVDVLVADWRVSTTEVGLKVYEDFSPSIRLAQLVEEYPERTEAFKKIMEFCREPKSMGKIDDAFKGKDFLGVDSASRLKRQPSSFVDKLGAAGALTWNGMAWALTDTGEAYLDQTAEAG